LGATNTNRTGDKADLILMNGHVSTQDQRRSVITAVALKGERFVEAGSDGEVLQYRGPDTRVVDLKGKTAIPGLNDSHVHIIRGGLSYDAELRWDGVTSLSEGMRRVTEQAGRTPSGQWVRVVGGWSEFQFKERRKPSLEEINRAAPSIPVLITNLYHDAMLNKAALGSVGYTKETPSPVGGEIQRDEAGNPTGLLVAKPNAGILYSTIAKAPRLSRADGLVSTRRFMRELNRFGITSMVDAGGGNQYYPDDYAVIAELAAKDQLTVRTSYNLFTQRPKHELEDYTDWSAALKPGSGSDFYRLNGAGEMLVYSGADFENLLEERPDLPPNLEDDISGVVTLLAQRRWPFRLHATYNESIERFLDVFEAVNEKIPFDGLRWFFDHAETITPNNIERVRRLGGGIAIQDRMAFQGEYFVGRHGEEAARNSPPVLKMVEAGIPVGAGTDATRVASYNPWISLYWLVAGKTMGGMELYPRASRLNRMEALRLYTFGSAWFSGEQDRKGSIEAGKLADLVVLSDDYFSIPDEEIKEIQSVLTVVGGRIVYAAGEYSHLAPPPLPKPSSNWFPTLHYPSYSP
jgi:predicted amidohydrolase YtcJ